MTPKKSAAQLDREIAAALAAGAPVKISVHEVSADEEDHDDERYMIADDGGEFDDSEETDAPDAPDVQGDIDDRRMHYRALGRRVILDVPDGRGWT